MERRGVLTPEIEKLGEGFFGKRLTLRELRLMPYIDYCAKNNQGIDPNRVDQEEREILSEWKKLGIIEFSSSPMNGYVALRKEFFDLISEILWLAYIEKIEPNACDSCGVHTEVGCRGCHK